MLWDVVFSRGEAVSVRAGQDGGRGGVGVRGGGRGGGGGGGGGAGWGGGGNQIWYAVVQLHGTR